MNAYPANDREKSPETQEQRSGSEEANDEKNLPAYQLVLFIGMLVSCMVPLGLLEAFRQWPKVLEQSPTHIVVGYSKLFAVIYFALWLVVVGAWMRALRELQPHEQIRVPKKFALLVILVMPLGGMDLFFTRVTVDQDRFESKSFVKGKLFGTDEFHFANIESIVQSRNKDGDKTLFVYRQQAYPKEVEITRAVRLVLPLLARFVEDRGIPFERR